MDRLTRITLGSINDLVEKLSEVKKLGEGTATGSRWDSRKLKLKIPGETRKIETSGDMGFGYSFLKYLNRVLTESELYLSDVEFREQRLGGFFPCQLRGVVYREVTE